MPTASSNESTVTHADLLQGLAQLGLESADTVLVHSSMKSFGHVDGGPDTVIDALLEALGPRGCLVMPTLTMGAAENPVVYDVRQSPSNAGLITEVFRQRPEALRSRHPLSSGAAMGQAADELTRYHLDTPADLLSPYGQVYLRGGWCLFLGAPWNSNTMFHVAEELVQAPYLSFAQFHNAQMIDTDGQKHVVTFRRYNCYQSGVIRDLDAMAPHYEKSGIVRHGRIGASNCRLILARDIVDVSTDLLRRNPEQILSYETTG